MSTMADTVRLTGAQTGELAHILVNLFDSGELERFVRTKLEMRLYDEAASERDPLSTVAFDLVSYLDRRGRIVELLTAAAVERPRDKALQLFKDRLLSGSAAPPPDGTAQVVSEAIVEATRVARTDRVLREMIGTGKVEFEITRTELGRVAQYKALHDCLHTLQFQLSAIARTARAFPTEPSAGRELQGYVQQLQRQARRARQKALGLLTVEDELAWVDEFDDALRRAQEAVRLVAAAEVAAAVEALGRLLPEAVRINTEMINAARRLAPGLMRRVASTLAAVKERLEAQGHSQQVVTRLENGSDGLFELAPRLAGLTDAHDAWQWIDNALAAAERLPAGRPAQRVPRWARVKQRLSRFCPPGSATDLTADPHDLAERWEAEDDPTAAENLFQGLQAAARQEFKEVDDRLLDLADQLTSTIGPLDALLGVI